MLLPYTGPVTLETNWEKKIFVSGETFSVAYNITDPGNPDTFTTTWMFNNQPFSGNSRVTIVADGLQFTNVMAADMGTYIVSFENQAGLSMYMFILTDSPDDFTPPPPPPRGTSLANNFTCIPYVHLL